MPLMLPSVAFDESVNCLDINEYWKLNDKFLNPNFNPVFRLWAGTNSTELPSTPTSSDSKYSDSIKE